MAHASESRRRPGSLPVWGGILVGAAMFAWSWLGVRVGHPADDAGIGLRYAERIAEGKGFAYNDGEAVAGASAPLHTLAEAALLAAGLEPWTVILALASAGFAVAAGVLFATFARFYSPAAAVVSAVAWLVIRMPFDVAADGMETPLVLALAAVFFRALHARGAIAPGLALGLLVADKLDGSFAAIAFAAVFIASRRRFPWKTAAVALLAAAPIFLLMLAQFGSIVPNSMRIKLSWHSKTRALDPLWLHQALLQHCSVPYLLAWSSFLWLPLSRELRRSFPIAVVQVWFLLHLGAFSTVNLGGPYFWYASALVAQSMILATFALHALASAALRRGRLDWDPLRLPARTWPVSLGLAALLAWFCLGGVVQRVGARSPSAPAPSVSWEIGRQAAGAWLRKHTSGSELLATFEGWPAYEYGGPVYDFALLNSEPDDRRFESATYLLVGPLPLDARPKPVRERRLLVASFRFDRRMGLHAIYAKPESEIARSGVRHLVLTPPSLGEPTSLAVPGRIRFTVSTPIPPEILFTPRLEGSGNPVLLTVRAGSAELGSVEVLPGRTHAPARFVAPARAGDGESELEIESRSLGGPSAAPDRVELVELLVRSGEPLRATDFKLLTPLSRERIEHVATAGLP